MEKLQQWRRKQEGKIGYILLGRSACPSGAVRHLLAAAPAPRRTLSPFFPTEVI